MEEQKKISLPEGILVTLLIGSMDLAEILLDLTIVGIIIAAVINFIGQCAIEVYLFLRGGRATKKMVISAIGGLLDGVTFSFLPIKTITWLITWFIINHPKIAKVAERAGGKVIEMKAEAAAGKAVQAAKSIK
jgi:hypothetical protein